MSEGTSTPSSAGRRTLFIVIGAGLVVAITAFFLWRHFSPRESTDDAQVTGHVSPVAARVGGAITAIHINDNQLVKEGDVLVEIDPHDYELAVSKAKADLAAAEAAAKAARTGVPITSTTSSSQVTMAEASTRNAEAAVQAAAKEADASRAKVASAQARLMEASAHAKRASQDLERLRPLVAKDEIAKQQFDAAVAADEAARAAVASAQAAVTEAQANVAVSDARKVQAEGALNQAKAEARSAATAPEQVALTAARADSADAQVLQARTALDQAQLNLDRTKVRAPATGVVSRKTIEQGQIIQPGQPLFLLTSLADVWVTANFKETQLDRMKPGQPVDIEVDAYGGRSFSGHIESLAAATGATFSLLPPDNATGNFVKVVQRVPVKIALDAHPAGDDVLRPGLSVTATVYLK
jgi:membrane fusion protein (multidrug efflux system)